MGLLDGNGAASTLFASGLVELAAPFPAGSNIRLTFDAQGVGQTRGYIFGVDDFLFRVVAPGDTDGNGELDVLDVTAIIDADKFDNPAAGIASWAKGDFNGDDLVTIDDILLGLATAKYDQGPYSTTAPPAAVVTVPEPSTFILAAFDLVTLLACARRHGTAAILSRSKCPPTISYVTFRRCPRPGPTGDCPIAITSDKRRPAALCKSEQVPRRVPVVDGHVQVGRGDTDVGVASSVAGFGQCFATSQGVADVRAAVVVDR